jgi:SAM-dependent methyltransferase
MENFRDYKDYTTNDEWSKFYLKYQQKYQDNPRECDKKMAMLVQKAIKQSNMLNPSILDIGCSTGNFLLLLQNVLQNADLHGGDLMSSAIENCRNNIKLNNIKFSVVDVFDIPEKSEYDIITAIAVNVYFEPDEYIESLQSICRSLKPGGWFIAYEWVSIDDKEQRIVEKSHGHPNGLKF